MAHRCLLCGTNNSQCGTPTRVIPADARVSGTLAKVGGGLMPVGDTVQVLGELTPEERVDLLVMQDALNQRSLRKQYARRAGTEMPFGTAAEYTNKVYVKCPDGITRKMSPDVAEKYVEMNEGAEITMRGEMPTPEPGQIIGASKATTGELFGSDGRQIADVQPLTSRTFYATDRVRADAVTPSIGSTGAQGDPPVSHRVSQGTEGNNPANPREVTQPPKMTSAQQRKADANTDKPTDDKPAE